MNTSSCKTFEREINGRSYIITYTEPSYKKEERTQEKEKIATQLYEIFSKYYGDEKQSGAV